MKLLDDCSGPDLDLRRVSLCEAVVDIIAHCFAFYSDALCDARWGSKYLSEYLFFRIKMNLTINFDYLINYFKVRLLLRQLLDKYSGPDLFRGEPFTRSRWLHWIVVCFAWGFSFWILFKICTYSSSKIFIPEKLPGSFQDWRMSVWGRTLQFGRFYFDLT